MLSGWRHSAGIWLLTCVVVATAAPVSAQVFMWKDAEGRLHFSDQPRSHNWKMLKDKSKEARVAAAERRLRSRPGLATRAWDGVIRQAASEHGVAPGLVKAVLHAESLFDQKAVSHKGAQGLMQLMPRTARSLGVDDPFNPWQNIAGGAKYLAYLIRRFEGDKELALAAYNAGETTVRRYGGIPPYRETEKYVRRVMSLERRYHADFR